MIYLGSPFQLGDAIIVLSLCNRDAFSKMRNRITEKEEVLRDSHQCLPHSMFHDACRKAYLL